MLCWICPDCGRDCSPAARECPYCAQQHVSITTGVLAIVEQLRETPPVPLLTAASEQYLLFGLTNGEPLTESSSVALLTDEPPVFGSETDESIDSYVRPLVESAKAEPPPEVRSPEPAPSTALRRELAAPSPQRPADIQPKSNGPEEFQLSVAKSVHLIAAASPKARIAPVLDGINLSPHRLLKDPAKPLLLNPAPFLVPVARSIELNNTVAPTSATSSTIDRAAAAEPLPPMAARLVTNTLFQAVPPQATCTQGATDAQLAIAAGNPVKPFRNFANTALAAFQLNTATSLEIKHPDAVNCPMPAANPGCDAVAANSSSLILPRFRGVLSPWDTAVELASTARSIADAFELRASELLAGIQAQIDAYQAQIGAIISKFQVQPAIALLPAAREIVTAPAAPDLQWKKAPRPRIPASKPKHFHYGTLLHPAQQIPLAGPCLPAELQNFIEPDMPEYPRRGVASGLPTWVISVILATALFLAGRMFLQSVTTNREGASPAVAQAASQTPAAAPQAAPFEAHPFARFVEVTGLRVVDDSNHHPQVQYIVVNHSSSQLTDMLIHIAVRSSQSPSNAPPLFAVSAVVPSLGPHQSKEIRTDLDSELRASSIPDWESLRTDVQVGTSN